MKSESESDNTIEEFSGNEFVIACPSCDYLTDTTELTNGQKATCSRCGHYLTQFKNNGISHVIAYTISALILLVFASSFPFLSFKASGIESVMTLPQTAWELYRYGMPELAILVAAFIIFIPLFILMLLLAISIPIYLNKPNTSLIWMCRLIFTLEHWAMVEVFLIGVIVSLVKIAAMATVVLGISFWAYAGFTICFTLALSNLDRLHCWNAIERLTPRAEQ